MTKKATQKIDENKIRKATPLQVLNCGIAIRGAELVPAKLIAILDYHILNIQKHVGVLAITFRDDNRPTNKLGSCHEWSYSAVINLQAIFNKTWAQLSKQDWGLNLRDALWLGLIETCLHEITHIHTAFQDEEAFEQYVLTKDDKIEEETEEFNNELTREFLFDLFKQVDCEAPSIGEMKFLGGLLQEIFIKEKDHKYIIRSQQMLENGLAYEDKEKSTYYRELRDFVRNALAPKDDDGWEDTTNLIKVSFHMEDGSVVEEKAEPVIDAEAAVAEATAAVLDTAYPETKALMTDSDEVSDEIIEETGQDMAAVIEAMQGTAPAISPQTSSVAGEQAAVAVEPAATVQPSSEEFQLPAHIAAPNAQVQANMAPQPGPELQPSLPVLDIPMDKIKGCLKEVYITLYNNLFLKCGWSVNAQTSRYHFPEPYAITASWQIGNILQRWGCEGLVHEYTSYAEGEEITTATKASTRYSALDGNVRGLVFSNGTLPAFELFLNIGGQLIKRRLIPQNPNKIVNNAYTKGADFAGVGNAVLYVYTDAGQDRPWNERCKAKIVNKQYQEQT